MEKKIIDLVPSTGTTYDFSYDGTTIWTQGDFYGYIVAKKRSYVYNSIYEMDSLSELEFASIFRSWASHMGESVSRALAAFNATYDPLENYDRYEDGSETHTIGEDGSEETARHKGTKTSTGEEIITTPRTKNKATNYKLAYDSNTEVETDATVTEPLEGNDKVERDSTKNFVTQTDVDANTYDRDVRSFTDRQTTDTLSFTGRRTHGNIGVTTSQQMIESELELRKRNLIYDYMSMFVNEFCYVAEGVE